MIFFQNRLGSVLEFLVGNLIHLHLQQFLFLILLCRAQCITDISLQRNKKPIMPCFFIQFSIFGLKDKNIGIWLQKFWLWNVWCEKWSGEVLPFWCISKGTAVAYNCQLLLLHFHFLSLCPWQFSLFVTFTFYNFARGHFHFSPLLLSIISPVTTFQRFHYNFETQF